MAWEVRFKPLALQECRGLPGPVQARVGRRLDALSADPRPSGVQELAGEEDFYRVRIGDYRVVYAIDDRARIVLVVKNGLRGGRVKASLTPSATPGVAVPRGTDEGVPGIDR